MGKYSGTVCPVRSVLVFSWRPLLSSCPRLHCPAYQYKTVEESSTRKWQKKLRTVVLLLHKIRKRIVIYIKGAKSQFLKKHHLSVSFRGPPQYLLSPDVSMVWATTIMVNGFLPATIVLICTLSLQYYHYMYCTTRGSRFISKLCRLRSYILKFQDQFI